MSFRSMSDVERALDQGHTVTVEVEGPLVVPGSRPGTLRLSEEATAAVDEEAAYWAFAEALGLATDEPVPLRLVRMPKAVYDRLRAEADKLPELLRESSRPDVWSPEDERQYREWARGMGLQ